MILKDSKIVTRYALIQITLILIFCIIYVSHLEFIPDYFSIEQNQNINSLLLTIISSIASISAIFLAIILIAFEYYKSNLKKVYLEHLSKNRYILPIILLPITALIFSTLSLIFIKGSSPISSGEITISYLSICAFLILPFTTFYCTYKLISELSIDSILNTYTTELSFNKIYGLSSDDLIVLPTIVREELDDYEYTRIISTDRLSLIQDLIISQYANDNFIQGQNALWDILKKFVDFICQKDNGSYNSFHNNLQIRLAHTLLKIISNTTITSQQPFPLLKTTLRYVELFYKELDKNKYPVSQVKHFREYFFGKLREPKYEVYRIDILETIKKITKNSLLNNLPNEKDIFYFDQPEKKEAGQGKTIKHDYEKITSARDNWDELREGFISYIQQALTSAIHNNSEIDFVKRLRILYQVGFPFEWTHNKKADNEKLKARWYISNYLILIDYYQQAIKRNLIHDIRGNLSVSFDMYYLFNNDNIAAQRILVEYLHFTIWLVENNKANYHILHGVFSMGDLGFVNSTNGFTYLGKTFATKYHDNDNCKFGLDNLLAAMQVIYEKTENKEYINYISKSAKQTKKVYFEYYPKGRSKTVTKRLNKIIKYAS